VKTANAAILWDKISLTYHSVIRIIFSTFRSSSRTTTITTTTANSSNQKLSSRKSRETMTILWFLKVIQSFLKQFLNSCSNFLTYFFIQKTINNTQNHNNSSNNPTSVVLLPSTTTIIIITTTIITAHLFLHSMLQISYLFSANSSLSNQLHSQPQITTTAPLLLTHFFWKTPSHSQQLLLME